MWLYWEYNLLPASRIKARTLRIRAKIPSHIFHPSVRTQCLKILVRYWTILYNSENNCHIFLHLMLSKWCTVSTVLDSCLVITLQHLLYLCVFVELPWPVKTKIQTICKIQCIEVLEVHFYYVGIVLCNTVLPITQDIHAILTICNCSDEHECFSVNDVDLFFEKNGIVT